MADQDRTATQALEFERILQARPYQFGFLGAIRRFAVLHRERAPIGKSLRPSDDPFRLSQEPHLEFAPGSLAEFHPGKDGRPPRLVTYAFGLFGPNGPLPLHITEFIRDRVRNSDDPTAAKFIDLFHHRLLSLFYRAWADAQPTVQLDRPESDRFAEYVGSLIGIGSPAFHDRDAVPDNAKRFHAGTLGCQTRHPDGLAAMLADFFQVPVEIQEFVCHWMELPDECRTRLAGSHNNGRLGHGAILGRRVWDCQSRFRLVFGPLTYADYQRLLPGGESLPKLVAFVRSYVGDEFDWELQLILKKEERPALRLGSSGQLRRNAWLSRRPGGHDADELVISPMGKHQKGNQTDR
jgi:type VI secretion system protein ImpH